MRKSLSLPLVLGVSLISASLFACGDDSGTEVGSNDETSGDGDGDAEVGDGDGEPGDGDGEPGDGDGEPGDGDGAPGDGDGAPGDGDGEPGDGDGEPGDCQVWEVTYALTDSEFEIGGTQGGAGDQVNFVKEPYAADNHIGPGGLVLRFQDVDGAPGGQAFMHAYQMTLNFVIKPPLTTVTTDLETEATPAACGITSGTLAGGSVAWMPSAIVALHTEGEILCSGTGCALGGLPAVTAINDTDDQPLSDFNFSEGVSAFTMAKTVINMDNASTTTWMYIGTETGRALVDAPACMCE